MRFLQCGLVLTAIVVVAFASEPYRTRSSVMSNLLNLETILNDKFFQNRETRLISESSDDVVIFLKKTINDIEQSKAEFTAEGPYKLAVEKFNEGILKVARLLNTVLRRADNITTTANSSSPYDAAILVNGAYSRAEEVIVTGGIPIVLNDIGAAYFKAGSDATLGLRDALISVEKAVNAGLQIHKAAGEIASIAVKSGGQAAVKGLQAAKESVAANAYVALAHLIEANKLGLEGLRTASNGVQHADNVPHIINSFKTLISPDSTAAQTAMSQLKAGSLLLADNPLSNVVNIVKEAFSSTILAISEAMPLARSALDQTAKTDVSDVKDVSYDFAIKPAEDKILSAFAGAYLALGAAQQIATSDVSTGLLFVATKMEVVKLAQLEYLRLAEKIAYNAAKTGGSVGTTAAAVALQLCDAIENDLYQQFTDAGLAVYDIVRTPILPAPGVDYIK